MPSDRAMRAANRLLGTFDVIALNDEGWPLGGASAEDIAEIIDKHMTRDKNMELEDMLDAEEARKNKIPPNDRVHGA